MHRAGCALPAIRSRSPFDERAVIVTPMTTEAYPHRFPAQKRGARRATRARLLPPASSAARAQFGWQLILGRALGAAGFGIYATVGALFAIGVTITAFSMSLIVIRDVARRPETAGRYLSATLVIETVLGLVAYVGINAAASGLRRARFAVSSRVAGLSLFIDMLGNDVLRPTARAGADGVDLGRRGGAHPDPHRRWRGWRCGRASGCSASTS